jgi:hypothetical protein
MLLSFADDSLQMQSCSHRKQQLVPGAALEVSIPNVARQASVVLLFRGVMCRVSFLATTYHYFCECERLRRR